MVKKLLLNLSIAGLVLIICFVLLEAGIRVTKSYACYAYPQGYYEQDDLLCYKGTPNFTGRFVFSEFDVSMDTNSQGFRDDELGSQKRVLLLGDSFAAGVGVEQSESFPSVLQRGLEGYDVVNAGVPSYDTWRQVRYLESNIEELNPEIVVLAFFYNDILGDYYNGTCTAFVRDGYLVSPASMQQSEVSFQTRAILNTKVQSYCFMNKNLLGVLETFKKRFEKVESPSEMSLLSYYTKEDYSGKTLESWETTKSLIKQLAQISRENNAEFVIVIIPEQVQVSDKTWTAIELRHGLDRNDYDMEKLNKLLISFGKENGIRVIDPLSEMREAAKEQQLYFPFDKHLTREGHEVIGQKLVEAIKK